ncbi:3-oxoacyl-ACP reductase [Alkalilimnicola ehrlichii]|uniref:3-oxoacyl-ACP reductase n=1 Tax=Alkalilimnicola ehrlichii TaxID=351052 RepID=A0A3E0X3Q7_9GAMM|nr:3-oxoacyl-ACP reductase [Alkalilimnicola ehrlichii]RFA31004.1 3-oxoacyl-ACP reductase [Alkalilimnicola ehrlichii]RFA38957.1 3-oxoacyl-ACP reductase [Alkalilimnicola ehrlichii]
MNDYLVQLSNNTVARRGLKMIGAPTPLALARASGPYQEKPLQGKRLLFAGNGFLAAAAKTALTQAGAVIGDPAQAGEEDRFDGIVFDASGVQQPSDLRALYEAFHPIMLRLAENSRVVVLTGLPEAAKTSGEAACRRGIEGFTRSVAKEIGKRGSTANLLYVAQDAEDRLVMPLRFFLSEHSTYVDGQAVRVTAAAKAPSPLPLSHTLADKTAIVTGAAGGIGAATVRRLAAEGAHVICVDIPPTQETLDAIAKDIGGSALALDVTADEAPAQLSRFVAERGGVDIVVHNAGVTRDRTLAYMKADLWEQTIAINLEAILRIDAQLQQDNNLNAQGRIVCLSSIAGIAGNAGQTNYGLTKAALIGYVEAEAPRLAARGITINAVAPGFIETSMTARMPFVMREGARRLTSLSQGGQPEDVAELICFLATPGASGINGNTVRVCGQSLVGA